MLCKYVYAWRRSAACLISGVASSSPAEGLDALLLCLLCVVSVAVSTSSSSFVQRSPVGCMCLIFVWSGSLKTRRPRPDLGCSATAGGGVCASVYYQLLTFSLLQQPKSGRARLIFEFSRAHPVGTHSLLGSSQRRHVHNTQQTQETNIHAFRGIQVRDSRNRVFCRPAPWIARRSDRPGFLIGIKCFRAIVVLTRNLWKFIPSWYGPPLQKTPFHYGAVRI